MRGKNVPQPRIPLSTYRLQFNNRFTFRDAAHIVEYLNELGITDVYSSPYFKAKQGSLHGYDIVDHNELNPEIGTEQDFALFISELKRFGMGQVLDIVPNHMYVESSDNGWWMDILENGPSSPFAGFFDIAWSPVKQELQNKILIPVLGDQYGTILEAQELHLRYENGLFSVSYYDHTLPVRPQTFVLILEHRIKDLESRMGGHDPEYAELLSIITALKNLPAYTETAPDRVEERLREKDVIKRRLHFLVQASPDIEQHIEENVQLFNGTKGDPRSFDLLDNLMNTQVYRLSYWRVATEEINYRRFFDINALAAVSMENPAVFHAAHALVFRLVSEGVVTGLRVDHPDGLYNPVEYFHRLQRGCFVQQKLAQFEPLSDNQETNGSGDLISRLEQEYDNAVLENPEYKPFYIIGEKILTRSERMPDDWPLFSTTGYVFINSVSGIFVDGSSAKVFTDLYQKFIRRKTNFPDVVYERKKLVMRTVMSSEVNTLGHYLNTISEKNRRTRDFTLNNLRRAVHEVIACFPVYRTYTNTWVVSDRDRQYVELAVSKAKRKSPEISESVFDFLCDVLLLRFPRYFNDRNKAEWLDFVMRFQQITGPVMAKGVEDTAFYVYNRLVSLNEVGGMPERFGTPLETFHGQNIERVKFWPYALIATGTHDTKRGEDVRVRLNVITEFPDEWAAHVKSWARVNKRKKTIIEGEECPDRNEEYLLYQTLVGAWPLEDMDEAAYAGFIRRIRDYMLKAAREAKVNTSWLNPNSPYEEALLRFVDAVLNRSPRNVFLNDLLPFQKKISHYGLFNSLSQTLLKICAPGVPDFYQGTDLWDFSLVDPDNRRPVDYQKRIHILQELKYLESSMARERFLEQLIRNKEDGRIRLYLIWKALNYRKNNRELFETGDYRPIEPEGPKARNACAFMRKAGNRSIIVAVPLFLTRLISGAGSVPFGEAVWGDTGCVLQEADGGARYRNVFTGEVIYPAAINGKKILFLSDVFSKFPVALLEQVN